MFLSMQVKDLIKIINVFDANIIFDVPKDVAQYISAGRSPLYFTPVEGKERKQYENQKNNQEFRSTTAAIHIIDLSVRELVNTFECDGTGIHAFTSKVIEPYCNAGIPRDVVFTVFLFLHEIGHWMQFVNVDKKVAQFLNQDLELEKENFDKLNAVKMQRQERMKRGNKCNLTFNERKLLEQYMQEYRNIPKEKDADEFAVSKMPTVLELYTNSNLSSI